jgi:hypothetical protein
MWLQFVEKSLAVHTQLRITYAQSLVAPLMRSSILPILLFWATARANPVVPDPPFDAFISSEKLAVTIGPAEARFNGTFTFKISGHVSSIEQTEGVVRLQIPIWFPADSRQSSVVALFWKAIDQTQYWYLIGSTSKKAIEQAVELKVVVDERSLQASDLVISGRGGYGYTIIPKGWTEPGYCFSPLWFRLGLLIMEPQ